MKNQLIRETIQYFKAKRKRNQMAEEMQTCAQKFEGLYQPVYMLAQDPKKKKSAIKEWQIRAGNLLPDSELTKFLNLFTESEFIERHPDMIAGFLVKCFERAGFFFDRPDESGMVKLSGWKYMAYRSMDVDELQEDDIVHVIMPAWYYGDKIIEHGLCGDLL